MNTGRGELVVHRPGCTSCNRGPMRRLQAFVPPAWKPGGHRRLPSRGASRRAQENVVMTPQTSSEAWWCPPRWSNRHRGSGRPVCSGCPTAWVRMAATGWSDGGGGLAAGAVVALVALRFGRGEEVGFADDDHDSSSPFGGFRGEGVLGLGMSACLWKRGVAAALRLTSRNWVHRFRPNLGSEARWSSQWRTSAVSVFDGTEAVADRGARRTTCGCAVHRYGWLGCGGPDAFLSLLVYRPQYLDQIWLIELTDSMS
jgi:hypothetical protein